MSGHNDEFSTNHFRTGQQPALLNSMVITTSSPATAYPIGISHLSFANGRDIRITSYFDNVKPIESSGKFNATIHLDGWGDSVFWGATCTWLPTSHPDREFQHGRVIIKPDQLIHGVTFDQEYASVPKVVVWLSGFHVDKDTTWQFRVDTSRVTTKGFTLKGEVWGTTKLHQMEATWVAYPSSRSNIESGQFIVTAAEGLQVPHQNSKAVTFGKQFDRAPRVYFAINRIDTTNRVPMRIMSYVGDVTSREMILHINSWDGTRMYSVEGQWIAIQDL